MASKCAPTNLSRDGKSMQIRAANSTVKQELTFRKTEILKKLQAIKGCNSIVQIRVFEITDLLYCLVLRFRKFVSGRKEGIKY